jgi:hypothetical protein
MHAVLEICGSLQFIALISAMRTNVHEPELHIGEACSGKLKRVPGMRVLKVYEIRTWLRTKFGASGSASGAGLPVPAVPQPELVQVSQFAA